MNIQFARKLRQDSTIAEQRLWFHLRDRRLLGYKFRRQHCVGMYICDFICIAQRLIIELDGGHHLLQKPYDALRTCYLQSRGYKVIRFWNHDVLLRTEIVLEVIERELSARAVNRR